MNEHQNENQARLNDARLHTATVLSKVATERDRQRGIGTDGALVETNDLVATALAYIGRGVEGVFRNEREGYTGAEKRSDMLIKAMAVLCDAVERLEQEDEQE